MFKIVQELLALRQIRFEKGKIILFDQSDLLLPTSAFIKIQKELEEEGKENIIYNGGKDAGYKWFEAMTKDRKMFVEDIAKWGANIVTLSGWGEAKLIEIKQEKSFMIFHLLGSTIGEAYGKSKEPVCHMFRGLVAGASEYTFKKKVEAVETKCIAKGDKVCEFVIQPKASFDLKNPLIKKQLSE